MSLFYKMTSSSLKAFFRLLYDHEVIFQDALHLPSSQGAIIASNHLSFLDPPLMAASYPEEIAFFARSTLFTNPFFKLLISKLNAHPVGKGNDLSSLKLACKLIEEGKKILIFPEGTRSHDGKLCQFKRGIAILAQRTKAPIIPTYIHGTFDIWPKNQRFPSLFGKKTACVFGKPIFFDESTHKESDIIIRVQSEIAALQQWYVTRNKSS